MVSGLRISFSITLLGVMIGEMFASQAYASRHLEYAVLLDG